VGRLTTHVLDLLRGGGAPGIEVELYALEPERRLVACARTNATGRTDDPLLAGDAFSVGRYELVFRVGAYFAAQGIAAFFDDVPVRVRIQDGAAHYHVPLLVAPWGYVTYRGS